jgi:hypothetical protein
MATSSTVRAPARVIVICTTCGSENVSLDAWAGWNTETQAWELTHTFDYSYCHACDDECRIEEIPHHSQLA